MTPLETIFASKAIKTFAYALFAAIGGCLGHLLRTINARQKVVFSVALLESLSAGFVGMIVVFFCGAMGLDEQWTGILAGIFGWLGAQSSLRILESFVFKKLGISLPQGATLRERENEDIPTSLDD